MHSLRSLEGYLMVNPGEGPTLSEEAAARTGKEIVGAGIRRTTELPTITCSHCHAVRFVNPLRTRDRPFCRKCNHYLCDECAVVATVTGECRPLNSVIEQLQERAVKAQAKAI